ncbi:hypothetical protein F4604DRAFT_1932887 [Suillus subluteus]|nr:hypothetical protein F4604DRAFT_1932887 [Suillus subluteus]
MKHRVKVNTRSWNAFDHREPDYNPNVRHCLYGPDADLIMLSPLSHDPHFCLLREQVKFGPAAKRKGNVRYFVVFVLGRLTERRRKSGEPRLLPSTSLANALERVIDDFILLAVFVGNDFLPNLPDLHIHENGPERLFDAYKKVFPSLDKTRVVLNETTIWEREIFEKEYADSNWFKGKRSKRVQEMKLVRKRVKLVLARFQRDIFDQVQQFVLQNRQSTELQHWNNIAGNANFSTVSSQRQTCDDSTYTVPSRPNFPPVHRCPPMATSLRRMLNCWDHQRRGLELRVETAQSRHDHPLNRSTRSDATDPIYPKAMLYDVIVEAPLDLTLGDWDWLAGMSLEAIFYTAAPNSEQFGRQLIDNMKIVDHVQISDALHKIQQTDDLDLAPRRFIMRNASSAHTLTLEREIISIPSVGSLRMGQMACDSNIVLRSKTNGSRFWGSDRIGIRRFCSDVAEDAIQMPPYFRPRMRRTVSKRSRRHHGHPTVYPVRHLALVIDLDSGSGALKLESSSKTEALVLVFTSEIPLDPVAQPTGGEANTISESSSQQTLPIGS